MPNSGTEQFFTGSLRSANLLLREKNCALLCFEDIVKSTDNYYIIQLQN
jgi:hypothetical protein